MNFERIRYSLLIPMVTASMVGTPAAVRAADYSAGDACSVAGALHTTNDAGGADVLICNGSNWLASMSYYKDGGLGISSLSGQPAPQYSSSTVLWSTGSGDDIYYNTGTPMVGIGTADPTVTLDVVGNINYTGVLTDVSDRRSKENIEPLEHPLESILALQGYSFTMKDDPEHRIEYGLIAQEVEIVFPELVVTNSNDMKTMNYLGMIAPLVEAVKAQQKEIEALKAEVNAIKSSQPDMPEAR